jgi:hypothetical protein
VAAAAAAAVAAAAVAAAALCAGVSTLPGRRGSVSVCTFVLAQQVDLEFTCASFLLLEKISICT